MILSVTHIESLELPVLEPYRTLRRPIEHQQQGIFIAEGDKVVDRLLESNVRMMSILCSPHWFGALKERLEAKQDLIDAFIAEERLMETIVGHRLHKCVMAIGIIPKHGTLDEMLTRVTHAPFLVAVDGIMNAENMGVIIRNCAGFSADALLVSDSSCDPYLRRSVRNSMGNIFRLPICYEPSLATLLESARSRGIRVFAADAHAETVELSDARFEQPCCIVLGSEGTGISRGVLDVCDESVRIPMRDGFDSFNVASASAVLMYEVQRRRRMLSRQKK
ncbi:MAG TPA: RNA methyltransferase [Bacteroidota bacterium]|nr:RNA methyltransferase [Bacteroidota bacterium]